MEIWYNNKSKNNKSDWIKLLNNGGINYEKDYMRTGQGRNV